MKKNFVVFCVCIVCSVSILSMVRTSAELLDGISVTKNVKSISPGYPVKGKKSEKTGENASDIILGGKSAGKISLANQSIK